MVDIERILPNGIRITTDIFYKDTNPYHYLNLQTAHVNHIKDTLPYNLAKILIVFVIDKARIGSRLQLKN